MSYTATFTLTVGSSINVGPFDIVGQPGDYSVATNVSRADLATGQEYINIPDTVTSFDITSDGACTNSINVPISGYETHTFEKYCSQNEVAHPISNATRFVVFSTAELGFTPTGGEFITILGSGNVDYIYTYSGSMGDAETVHTFGQQLTAQEFVCDGDPLSPV
jgi:hypothetical protein